MNGNPEGTPNPLNPVQGARPVEPMRDMAAGTGSVDGFTKPAGFTRPTGSVSGFTRPTAPTNGFSRPATNTNIEGFAQPNGTAGSFNRPAGIDGFTQPRPTHTAVDPMMRPASRPANTELDPYDSFEALSSSDFATGMQKPMGAPAPAPELTAKDSIVEPAGGKSSKKKPLIIGAIVLILVAAICGAAAVAIALISGNGGDKVSKAIEKLMNGQVSSIIEAEGNISISPNTVNEGAELSSANVHFDGTFDTTSSLNKVEATVTGEFNAGGNFLFDVSELTNKNGETFFKFNGLNSILTAATPAAGTNAPTAEATATAEAPTVEINLNQTVSDAEDCSPNSNTDCVEPMAINEPSGSTRLLSIYSGLISAANDQWILASGTFSSDMQNLEINNNPTVCVLETLGSLSNYSDSVAKSYKENPFITYSTDKLGISKKRNDLYRLNFDADKLKSFENSLDKAGFLSKLNSCFGGVGENNSNGVSIADILGSDASTFPTVYAEVDDDYNFTRIYFESENATLNNTGSATVTADINLSYPKELKVVEPDSYIEMSTLLSSVMGGVLSGNTGDEATE